MKAALCPKGPARVANRSAFATKFLAGMIVPNDSIRHGRLTGETETNTYLQEKTMTTLKNFLNDEQGQDMVEYTLILAFVALGIGALWSGMQTDVTNVWQSAKDQLDTAAKNTK